MHLARIAELLKPFLKDSDDQPLTTNDALLQHISTYIDILQHWNARINLTAIRNEDEIVTRHFGESLFAATHLFPPYRVSSSVSPVPSVVKDADSDFDSAFDPANDERRTTNDRLADVGSGAGFPGIPIKLWAPNIALTLIESSQKKSTFLREVARTLTLTDINIQNVRAETLSPSTFDVVTLRAVERFAEALPIAAALLSPGGRLALLIASSQQGATLTALPDFAWNAPVPIPQSQSRMLLIGHRESK
jgi:16S rRNA (guanine527-N7)-methyltransferase